jgi:hypothetical protein
LYAYLEYLLDENNLYKAIENNNINLYRYTKTDHYVNALNSDIVTVLMAINGNDYVHKSHFENPVEKPMSFDEMFQLNSQYLSKDE